MGREEQLAPVRMRVCYGPDSRLGQQASDFDHSGVALDSLFIRILRVWDLWSPIPLRCAVFSGP